MSNKLYLADKPTLDAIKAISDKYISEYKSLFEVIHHSKIADWRTVYEVTGKGFLSNAITRSASGGTKVAIRITIDDTVIYGNNIDTTINTNCISGIFCAGNDFSSSGANFLAVVPSWSSTSALFETNPITKHINLPAINVDRDQTSLITTPIFFESGLKVEINTVNSATSQASAPVLITGGIKS